MVIESNIAQQASVFADSLNVSPAPSTEKTIEEEVQQLKTPEQQGDMVTISEEARALAAPEKPGNSNQSGGEKEEDTVTKQLKERIEKIEEEIKALEDSDLPQKEKLQQIQGKQAELMELRDQLLKAEQEQLKSSGQAQGGGTRANGFGSSVSSF